MQLLGYSSAELKKLIAPMWFDKKNFLILLIRGIYFGMTGSVYAIGMKFIINAVQVGNVRLFVIWTSVIACMMFFNVSFGYSMRNAKNKFQISIQSKLYDKYLKEYLTLDNNKVEQLGTGRINNIIQKGCDNRMRLLISIPQDMTNVLLRIVVGMYLIAYYLGWVGFVVVTLLFGIAFVLSQYSNKRMASIRREMRDNYTHIDRDIIRLIMSKTEVLQNHKWTYEAKKLVGHFTSIAQHLLSESKMRFWGLDMQRASVNAIQVFLLFYVGFSVLQGRYDLGLIAMFWMLSNQINGSIIDLNDYITGFYQQTIYISKLRETFDEIPQIKGYETGKTFTYEEGNIQINDLHYNYGKTEVLQSFSLEIEGGKKTALVGISGSGKSTLIKLIAGYIHPQKGEIFIDNQPLPSETNKKYVSLKSYYKHVGYLTQEPNVFDGTIYDNLTYSLDHEPSQEELEQAIQGAQCQFIYEFPDGVQTEIGEKGIKLSGGQRQRLAIAKVMLKNPQIILLDEPTSALDSFSEEEVTKAFNNLFQGRTVVVIAHRLQTVKKADRIVVLDHGQIVEEGNHDSLVKSGGVYAKMLELQSGF